MAIEKNMGQELKREDLIESVKTLVELDPGIKHIHLNQHKLFTLFSIAFQYMLFSSTKNPGAYIIRVEDSILAEKLAKKAKDATTKKFMQALLIPRKLKYNNSMFYLDFFNIGSWNLTNDIPQSKIRGAVIVKNTSARPMSILPDEEESTTIDLNLPANYFYYTLQDIVPKTILISIDGKFDNITPVNFPFIKKGQDRPVNGVIIAKNIDLEALED